MKQFVSISERSQSPDTFEQEIEQEVKKQQTGRKPKDGPEYELLQQHLLDAEDAGC